MSFKIDVLKSFAKFRRKDVCWSLFSTTFQTQRPKTLLKEDPSQVFPEFSANFLRTTFYGKPPDNCFCLDLEGFHRTTSACGETFLKSESSVVFGEDFALSCSTFVLPQPAITCSK